MKIIISPAKKISEENDFTYHDQRPKLLEKAKQIQGILKRQELDELIKIYGASKEIASKAKKMLEKDVDDGYLHALLAYNGLQYQALSAKILNTSALDYLSDHLLILSGLYGGLRPFDLIVPYRLEMQSKLPEIGSLYDFWQDEIYQSFIAKDELVINLASLEYAKVITKYHAKERILNIHFLCHKNDQYKVITTEAKKGRGAMLRYLAENKILDQEAVKDFKELGFRYDAKRSNPNDYYFIKEQK